MRKGNYLRQIIYISLFALFFNGCSTTSEKKEFKLSSFTLPETFLLGSHLCRFPMPPMEEMLSDMENLKEHGFNLIKIQTHWAVDEPLEGQYDFSRYDRLVEYAKKLDMYVYMGLTMEQAPAWLYEKYPDCRMVGRDGLPVKYETQYTLPADGKPGPCFDHPDAMRKQLEFIDAFVRHFAKYDNILVWNTWQEIAYWEDRVFDTEVCYCENTQEHFRKWLKEKYGSLDSLNICWSANYSSWEQVAPQRQKPLGLPVDKDFRYFMENEHMAQTLKARYMAIKNADPLKRPVFAHKSDVNIGSGQDWTYARCEDFMGSSSYPAWYSIHWWDDNASSRVYPPRKYESLYHETWSNVAMKFDYLRCANPDGNPIWSAEFQGGPIMSEFHKGRVPTGTDIRRWMLTSMGSGVTAISFWVTRAEIMASENNGFSLLDSKGTTTERFEEASKIGVALRTYSNLFAVPSKPKAKVGIIISEDNYQFGNSFFGLKEHLSYSIRGWYHMLWRIGVAVDFVEMSQIDDNLSKQYKALILPVPIYMSSKDALRLQKYASNGGNLICEGAAGRIDENSKSVRGEMSSVIAEMAGVEQKSFTQIIEPNNEMRWTPKERSWGEYGPVSWMKGEGVLSGEEMLANFYLQTFELKGGTPVFRVGNEITGVVNKVGSGKIWLFGTFLGHDGTAYFRKSNLDFVMKLMNDAKVSPQKIGELLVQKRIAGNKEAWIITNPTNQSITESINLTDKKSAELLIGKQFSLSENKMRIQLKSLEVAVFVFEKQ